MVRLRRWPVRPVTCKMPSTSAEKVSFVVVVVVVFVCFLGGGRLTYKEDCYGVEEW